MDEVTAGTGQDGANGVSASEERAFDFDEHRRRAVDAYRDVLPVHERHAAALKSILSACIGVAGIPTLSIEARAKSAESFGRKAAAADETNPGEPKYPDPLADITDLTGVRVIAYFPRQVEEVEEVISREFEVLERTDKSERLIEEEKFGYQSVHFLVRLSASRANLPEYSQFGNLVAELQVRTILQHAWAEIEHDIQYKSTEVFPAEIHRRFMALAGTLEIADREFQAIADEDLRMTLAARTAVAQGRLSEAEITPDSLKTYLDRRLGPDARTADWWYQFSASALKRMGFRNLGQVDECIHDYGDGDRLSRIAYGSRYGQRSRFDLALLAGMGENWVRLHPITQGRWAEQWMGWQQRLLSRMAEEEVPIGAYDPRSPSEIG